VLERDARPGEAGSRIETWRLRCPPPGLAGREVGVEGLEPSAAGVVLRIERADGGVVRGLLDAGAPRLVVPERESAWAVLLGYGRLGFDHIGSGWDHLLFVLGLVLLAGSRARLLMAVTAFTLGHSVTLVLAALDLVRLAPAPVEIGIAASLLYLASELARPGGRFRPVPAALAAAFGLLHGLGFAGALRDVGLPAGAVPLALLGFNVGIELGQLAFVLLLLGVAAAARAALGARAQTLFRPTAIATAYGLGTIAAFWMFERIAALG
jgi:hydrogenase/urease accessory protein HupE